MGKPARVRIYQLFLRLFGNTRSDAVPHGPLARNGVGRFCDLDDRALGSLRELGATHLWLLGMPRHATGSAHPGAGLEADDPDLLKGVAGSPFALRDVFDVCPDYAVDPGRRRDEFSNLVDRCHRNGLQVLVDFVPNHVARSHRTVVRPDLEFGRDDDRSVFHSPRNHFFYLQGDPPLRLPTVRDGFVVGPTCQALGGCDGLFDGERDFGRVTGNNVASWNPGPDDWYETVKLNYGFDFTRGPAAPRDHPTVDHPDVPIPSTWHRMDAVLAHWQAMGVDGFRCDMAHMIPVDFWRWAIRRARERETGAYFLGEAYDDDPAKTVEGDVLEALLGAGFDAVYDHRSYRVVKDVYDGPKWANDLDTGPGGDRSGDGFLRYAENHDEVRLANPGHWGGLGAPVGRPVTALLYALGRGPVLLHNGQEVGEPALQPLGHGGAHGRTSLFDYGSMPELARWVNGHRYDGGGLTPEQADLREWYGRLLKVSADPALSHGASLPLNPHNVDNPRFGRLPGETASGHWLHACLRHDRESGDTVLVVVNLHATAVLDDIRIRLTPAARDALAPPGLAGRIRWVDRLGGRDAVRFDRPVDGVRSDGVDLPPLPPLTAWYLGVCR